MLTHAFPYGVAQVFDCWHWPSLSPFATIREGNNTAPAAARRANAFMRGYPVPFTMGSIWDPLRAPLLRLPFKLVFSFPQLRLSNENGQFPTPLFWGKCWGGFHCARPASMFPNVRAARARNHPSISPYSFTSPWRDRRRSRPSCRLERRSPLLSWHWDRSSHRRTGR